MSNALSAHVSVMLDEVVCALAPQDGEVYVDATFGLGGYTKAFLDKAACNVVAIDRDPAAIERSNVFQKEYQDRFTFVRGAFGDASELIGDRVDGFVMDLGVSSPQLDIAERGFSFRFDGPLDMRMDTESDGETAADVVNGYEESDLADIIYKYGQERHSRRIAKAIVAAREEGLVKTTLALAEIVRAALPFAKKEKIDPATRTFQALRIHVNRELEQLEDALVAAEKMLRPGGRLIVVSFHSLEDSIVKNFMRKRSGETESVSRHIPVQTSKGQSSFAPGFTLPSRKAVFPSDEEAQNNPRSRSARMRVAVRTDAPAPAMKEAV